jgi:TIR domain
MVPAGRRGTMTTALLSYARADKAAAQRLATELAKRGITATFPESLVSPGDSWVPKLETAIDNSDLVFILISREYEKAKWPQFEQEMAIASSEKRGRPRVVPVLLSPNVKVPFLLRSIEGIAFYDESRLEKQLDLLVDSIAERPSRTADEAAEARRAELDYIRASKRALQREIVVEESKRSVRTLTIGAGIVGGLAALAIGLVGGLGIFAFINPQGPNSVLLVGLAVLLFGLGALWGIAALWIYSRWLKPLFHGTGTE